MLPMTGILPAKKFVSVFLMFVTSATIFSVSTARGQSTRVRETTTGDETPTIFDVRKSLPMEPTDPSYHDFYINAGVEAGFKKGQYLPVQRALPVHDPVQNKQQAILTVPVGKILVIHAERNITVARLATELGDDERPTLEYEAIMIGDRIDMKGITTEAPKELGKKKKKTASAASVEPTVAVAIEASSTTMAAPNAGLVAPGVDANPVAANISENKTAGETSMTPAGAPVPALAPAPAKNGLKSDVGQQPSAPQRVTQPVPPPTA